jgi:hypothetical protein
MEPANPFDREHQIDSMKAVYARIQREEYDRMTPAEREAQYHRDWEASHPFQAGIGFLIRQWWVWVIIAFLVWSFLRN